MKFKPIITTGAEPINKVAGQLVVDIVDKSIFVDIDKSISENCNEERIRVGMALNVDDQIESINSRLVDLKEKMNFSLEEVNTGKRWIDGSYIYRKTIIHTGNLNSGGTTTTILDTTTNLFGVSDIKFVGAVSAVFYNLLEAGATVTPLTAIIEPNMNVRVFVANPNLSDTGDWYITFEYIKVPRLNDLSWNRIRQISEAGTARLYWDVDDKKTVTLSDNSILEFRIIGFNHDSLASDDNIRAGITFATTRLMPTTRNMNPTNTAIGGWRDSEMRTWLQKDVFSMLPLDLQSEIKPVQKISRFATSGLVFNASAIVNDTLFLFAEIEIVATGAIEGGQYEYWRRVGGEIYTSRIMTPINSAAPTWWWLRTSRQIPMSSSFRNVGTSGRLGDNAANMNLGICFGFCI